MKKILLKNWEKLFMAKHRLRRENGLVSEIFLLLSPREQKILSLRFGLDDGITRNLEEVGQEFGVTRERIRQIEDRALERLRGIIPTTSMLYKTSKN